MTLNQLECFMVLAQRLNFTQAADDLFMAQPALSRLISALEKELDLQLFYRNSRSVALTPAGTVFFKKCPKILDEYRGSVVAARLAQEGYRGSLTLGIMRDTFEPKLPTLYQRFRTAYPHVSLLIRGYSHSSLLSALERGEVDAILNYMPMPSGQESPSILLHKNHQCIITALDHPLASRGSIRMEEVKDEPFVVMARTASIPRPRFLSGRRRLMQASPPMWWRRPLMCRFCSPWFPAVLESLPSAMIWPVSARARWLLSPCWGFPLPTSA